MLVAASSQQSAMDRMYRHQRHIYDLSRRFYLLGRDEMLAQLDVPKDGLVLEIGCGTGRNLVAVAQRFPSSRVDGCDISGEMLKSAGRAIVRAGLEHRIRLGLADAANLSAARMFGRQHYDRIYFSYTLSMIPQWRDALACAVAALRPDGELHIVDFGQCEALPHLFRTALFRWLNLFGVSPRHHLPAELNALAAASARGVAFRPLYGGYAWHAVCK